MKTVILALLVLVVVSQGEALRCYCGGTYRPCSGQVETCGGINQVCGTIIYKPVGSIFTFEQGCMTSSACDQMSNLDTVLAGDCCRTDLCNRLVNVQNEK